MRKFDVVLISPPNTLEDSIGRAKVFVNATPPYGILYLAAYLEREGMRVKVVDAFAENLSLDEIVRSVAEAEPLLVGISCLTSGANVTEKICVALRTSVPDVKICLGNIHPTFYSEYYIINRITDYIVHGEGEKTLLELAEKLRSKEPVDGIQGISILKDGKSVRTEGRSLVADLDTLPFPARDKVPIAKYKFSFFHLLPENTVGIFTSRGCPMGCTFCCVQHGRKYRFNSVDYVISEIRHVVERYGAEYILILDSLFITSHKRVFEFCRKLKESGLNIQWGCSGHVNLITEELVREMKAAGCNRLDFGIESGEQSLLDYVNKGTTIEGIQKALAIVDKAGVSSVCAFIIGLPNETEAMTKKTVEFMLSLPIERANLSLLALYPGTKMFTDIVGTQTDKKMDWNEFNAYYSFGDKDPYYLPEGRTLKELKRKYFGGLWRFYLRPRQIWVYLRSLRIHNLGEVLGYFKSMILSTLKSMGKSS